MKKLKSQLVCQYLEKVSRSAIEKHQDIIRQFIRTRHGIYVLYKNNRLVYVGLATDLRNRLKQHLKDRHALTWNRFSIYITIGDDKLKELETLTLRIANPSDNRQIGRFVHAEDLKKNFKCLVQDKQKKELRHIFDEEIKEISVKVINKKYSGRKPALADYITKPIKIKLEYNKKEYIGIVKKDGSILINKKRFTSPSLAARDIVKYHIDGWHKWKYERSPGEWVLINKLRL